nr:uncharacterized protein C15orf39 homolog [Vulpes vulpes]
MAEKRPLGTLGPVMYGKLPRLEADSGPGHSLTPSAGNQDPCSYKGAYFSCPMGSAPKAGSERLASWIPYPPLYPASVAGPPLRTDNLLTSCLLYRPPAESSEKVQDPGPVELLSFGPQSHTYPGPPLAAPKPVYRNPLCYGLSPCLGEGAAKRPLDVDWTMVTGPLLPPADPPCSLTPAPGKGQSLDGTFLRGVPAEGPGKNSVSFSPCQAFLEKYRTIHGTGFLPSKYAGPYSGDSKQVLSEGPPSPWTQLAQPLGPACQDTVPTHYPLPHPPEALPCPSACRHPEKQGSYGAVLPLQPLGAHKGAGYPAGGLSSPYLRQQAAQTPYMPPVGLDTFSCPSAPPPAPSPGLKLEPPLAPRCPLDFAPQTLSFPYARDDLSLYGASPGLGGTPPSQNSLQAVPQPSAFQRACQPLSASQPCPEPGRSVEKPAQEAEEKMWLPSCRKEQLQPQLDERPGAPIVIGDSPVPHTPPGLAPYAQERRALLQSDGTLPPGSPPMPVIDNVFSLAPYRDYLDVQAPEDPTEPTLAPAPSGSPAKDSGAPLASREAPAEPLCSRREEVALDLSVKRPVPEAPIGAPSPPAPAQPPAAPEAPGLGNVLPELPDRAKAAPEAAGSPVPATADEAAPRTNFHSSVAFMFRKFKILRPAPLPAAPAPAPATPPAAAPPAPPTTSVPLGLQILSPPLGLLGKLLSQLQRFVCTQQCPFPHVVRAGAIFVPIHLVKERLFPRLPPASVDHVLQEHRVELRPTTLSEERALRERALHGCTSRMLKLLALRQLPDIYPDLLGLQWRDCVRRQLGDFDTEAGSVPSSEPTMARDEPESLALAWKSPVPKARKPGRKPPTPGLERAEAAPEEGARGASPAPAASTCPQGPILRARFRSLLETAWLNGLALPTWGHKATGPDRSMPQPQALGDQSHPL